MIVAVSDGEPIIVPTKLYTNVDQQEIRAPKVAEELGVRVKVVDLYGQAVAYSITSDIRVEV